MPQTLSAKTAPSHVARWLRASLVGMVLAGLLGLPLLVTGVLHEAAAILGGWHDLDTWIVITAALAAMACAAPGVFLVLRRQSMMGDALSHTVLPGIVVALLISHGLRDAGWITPLTYGAIQHTVLFGGALALGLLTALLAEWVQKFGEVESSAALGVVFTTLFAAGLILIRIAADNVHIDPDCVLYGNPETVTAGETGTPRATITVGLIFLVNLLLVVVFYKELRLAAFDPGLGTTLGINATAMHYALMAVTAATLVAAFEVVGSILVIAMLIAPAATAYLLTDRLSVMLGLSFVIAAASAVLGHVLAITLPPIIFGRLGFPTVVDASTAGMMAAASGLLFVAAMFFAPRHGILSKLLDQASLRLRIVREDVLGLLYRLEERQQSVTSGRELTRMLRERFGTRGWEANLAIRRLHSTGQIIVNATGCQLAPGGRESAQQVIRSHRLWESYLAKHFELPDIHLHESAERIEHFLDPALRDELVAELDAPAADPHGRTIPSERP